MPHAKGNGASLYYEDTGQGPAIVFLHEYADDLRSWKSQVGFFSAFYRCLAFNARGYPPSTIPTRPELYGQEIAVNDIETVLAAAGIDQTYLIGLSMGAASALQFALRNPDRVLGLVAASGGAGADTSTRTGFLKSIGETTNLLRIHGMKAVVDKYTRTPNRSTLLQKNTAAWKYFQDRFLTLDATGAAFTLENIQGKRTSLFDEEASLRVLKVPTLLAMGDQDDSILKINVFLKSTIQDSQLWISPNTGHAINLEEPDDFNTNILRFFRHIERKASGY